MNAVDLLDKGGWVMYPILGCSIAALTIIVAKLRQFGRLNLHRTEFVDQALSAIERNDAGAAAALLQKSAHPVSRVMLHALNLCETSMLPLADIEAEIGRVGSDALRRLDNLLRGLAGIAQLAPLLGLLGTVLGMISAFMTIQNVSSAVNPAVLAGGIWEALLTTAFGLIVAVPAMAFYYYFEGRVDDVQGQMQSAVKRILFTYKRELREAAREVRPVGGDAQYFGAKANAA